jgi:peptidoglycan hydrolase CwlO-like protein
MKKLFIILLGMLLLTSCGVGSYSISSGNADESKISFVSTDKTPITVKVDNVDYNIFTVKTKAWRTERNIKETAENTIKISPGQHNVIVEMDGKVVCDKKIFVSSNEHKVIEL